MAGLARVLEICGSMKVNGVLWLYDYVQKRPRLASEMTALEIKASEKAKWQRGLDRSENPTTEGK